MDTSKKLLEAFGISKSPEDIHPSTRFCNLNKLEFEPDSKLPAPQKLWAWMVKCLQGNKAQAGPYYYFTQQCIPYDIAHLFKRLGEVLDTVITCALDDEVYNVTHLDFDPSNQDIFGYLEDLRRALARLNDLNERIPEAGRVLLLLTFPLLRKIKSNQIFFPPRKAKITSKGKIIRKHAPVLLFRQQVNAPKLAVSICNYSSEASFQTEV